MKRRNRLPKGVVRPDQTPPAFSFLETARVHTTNHPGLLILDEPRQQSTAELSFEHLLARASEAEQSGQQVIFATSEEPDTLNSLLQDIPHDLKDYSARKILQEVDVD
jgi:hypothetical protein